MASPDSNSRTRALAHSRNVFLALGDSYTIGEGVEPHERWPDQLVAALRAAGVEIADPRIVARTGWTTDELSAAIDAERLDERFDLVTLLIGVNNQYRGRSIDEYRMECHALLARAVAFAGGNARRVIALSIPDWGVTPFAAREGRNASEVGQTIDAFNSACRAEAQHFNTRFVDVTGISRRARSDMNLLAADELHPSGAMYALWVNEILPEAVAALNERSISFSRL